MESDGAEADAGEEDLAPLAERLLELRDEKKYLEGEIERVSERLAKALGAGARQTLGSVEVRVTPARPGLRIISEQEVPEAFRAAKPDRGLLLDHIRRTGEVPAGVEVTEGRPVVYAKLKPRPDEAGG